MTGRNRLWLLGGVVVGVVVLAVVGYVLFFRSDAPPRVSTEAALVACQQVSREVEPVDTPDGTWTVLGGEGAEIEDGSFVGYRVDEELTAIGANTAVGRTADVTGSLVLTGTVVHDVAFDADLTGLQSDDARRDASVQRVALETDRFPTASFTLDDEVDLGSLPADGEIVEQTVSGSLTLHGETQPVEVTVEAQILGEVVVVVGGADIALADFAITPPKLGPVVSVADVGEVEFQLCLSRDA